MTIVSPRPPQERVSSARGALKSSGSTVESAGVERAHETLRAGLSRNETKRREAVWDLFQSECAFLYDHLMVLKNVSLSSSTTILGSYSLPASLFKPSFFLLSFH